jgi:hypothetical protein
MSRVATAAVTLVGFLNTAGIIAALMTPTTGDGLGDALEANFRFIAFSCLGLLINLGFVVFILFRWKGTSKRDRAICFGLLPVPVLAYLLLALLGALM